MAAAAGSAPTAVPSPGLPAPLAGLPVARALSLGAHESQSLFWERCVGLSEAFCEYLAKAAAAAFPDAPAIPAASLYAAFNRVKHPSFIRVEADELQYPLHIVLRYTIEKGVVDGNLSVADIPARWAELSQELLGVTPTSDRVGCLQDMHWWGGREGSGGEGGGGGFRFREGKF